MNANSLGKKVKNVVDEGIIFFCSQIPNAIIAE